MRKRQPQNDDQVEQGNRGGSAGPVFDVNGLSAGGVARDVGQAAAFKSIMDELRAEGLSGNELTAAFNKKYGSQWGGPTPELIAEMQKRMVAAGFKGDYAKIAANQYTPPTK